MGMPDMHKSTIQ